MGQNIKCDSRSLNTCLVQTATTLVLLFHKSMVFRPSYYYRTDAFYRYLQHSFKLFLLDENSTRYRKKKVFQSLSNVNLKPKNTVTMA